MIVTLVIFIILLIAFNIIVLVLVKNLLMKNKVYEQWILEFKADVLDTYEIINNIDKQGTFATALNDKGIFETDDQVGQVFKELLHVIEKLNERTQ